MRAITCVHARERLSSLGRIFERAGGAHGEHARTHHLHRIASVGEYGFGELCHISDGLKFEWYSNLQYNPMEIYTKFITHLVKSLINSLIRLRSLPDKEDHINSLSILSYCFFLGLGFFNEWFLILMSVYEIYARAPGLKSI